MDTVYSCIFLIFMWKEMEYEGLKCLQKVRKKFEKSSKKCCELYGNENYV